MTVKELIVPVQERLEQLGPSNRRALGLLALLAVASILWLGAVSPVLAWRSAAVERFEYAVQVYGQLNELAPLAMAVGTSETRPGGDLITEVRRQANRYGLSVQSFEPNNNALRLNLGEVAYSKLVQFIVGVTEQGLLIQQLTIETTDEPGLVVVKATVAA